MSLIVADTTPLNYLILIERESLLQALFSRVIIPSNVHKELLSPLAPPPTRAWASSLPGWAQVQTAERLLELPRLDPGETEAISLAEELGSAVLLDEKRARIVAEGRGLSVVGTLGLLRIAAESDLVNFEEAIDDLRKTNARISDTLVQTVRLQLQRNPAKKRDAS